MLPRLLLTLSELSSHIHYEANRFTRRLYGRDRSPVANAFWRSSIYLSYLWFKLEAPYLQVCIDKTDPWCWRTASKAVKIN